MDFLNTEWDPYAALLECQHNIEQLRYHLAHQTEIVNRQAELLHAQAFLMQTLNDRVDALKQEIEDIRNEI